MLEQPLSSKVRQLLARLLCLAGREQMTRTIVCYCLLLVLVAAAVLQTFTQRHSIVMQDVRPVRPISNREDINRTDFIEIHASLPKAQQRAGSAKCSSPSLPLYSDFIRQHRPALIAPDLCRRRGSPNWLRVSKSRVQLRSEFAAANCSAQPVLRLDDSTSGLGSARPISSGSELPSVGFRASCQLPDGRKHSSVYYGVKRLQLAAVPEGASQRDNIVVLGLDSLSRLESLRSLVNASRLLKERLGGISMQQYNIMGDGTPAALVPILTGAREEEMPEARRGFKDARHLDESMRFIFHKLRDLGYLTLYGEEGNSFGTFQLRFLGFKKEPADFYLRPALLQQEAAQTQRICIGDEVAAGRMLNAVKDMFVMYPDRPKFSFTFFSTLSHESLDLTPMDSELSKFLDWFVAERLIGNTTLVLMSDHGQRLGPLRNSMQGKLEESLPLMTFALSRQLTARLTAARRTLETNQDRLTAPTDIHQTLLSIAGAARDRGGSGSQFRSYSLIEEAVPENRSCSDAGIPTHWCSCLSATRLEHPASHQLALRAAQFAVNQMNLATKAFRNLCAELQLDSIVEAEVSLANLDLSKRERRTDAAFAYNVEIKSLASSGYITTRLSTEPNGGLYEATVQFALHNNTAAAAARTKKTRAKTVKVPKDYELKLALVGEISRTNKYGRAADCIVEKMPSLRKFCYCKSA